MSAASEGSLLRQQRSAGEDSIDDEFTLEELSLVQHLLPPERFVRVLLALRVTLRSCSELEDLQTPSRKLQPDFDLNSCTSRASTQSYSVQVTGQHVSAAQSPLDGGAHLPPRHHQQVLDSSSSEDDDVSVPARQFPTAAAEFWFRLQHGADKQAFTQAEEFGGDQEEAEQILPHLHGSSPELQSVSHELNSEQAAHTASSRQQQCLSGKPVQASIWPSQLRHVQESMLQRLTNGRSLADANPRPDLGIEVTNHRRMQHSSAACIDSDSDTDDDDSTIDEDDRADSKQPFVSQLQSKDAVRDFLARLRKPRSVSQQQQQLQPSPLQQTQQEHMVSLQRQQQQQVWHRTPAWQAGLAAASVMPHSAGGAASTMQHSNNAEVYEPQAHPDALEQPSHWMAQDSGGNDAGIEISPMQSAVSAVVDRLQSVQMGLAGAEDRLALLTGRKPAVKRLAPMESQSVCLDPMQSPAAQDGCQLYDLEQSTALDGAQHDPVEPSAAQDADQLHGLERSSAAQDRAQLHNLLQSSAAQDWDQQHDPVISSAAQENAQQDVVEPPAAQAASQLEHSPATQDRAQLHDLAQSSGAQDQDQLHDPVVSSAAQEGRQLHNLVQSSAAQDGGQQHDAVEAPAAQASNQLHDVVQSSEAEDGGQQHDLVESLAAPDASQLEQSSAAQDKDQQQDLVQLSPVQSEDQQHDLERSSVIQDEGQQHDLVESSAALNQPQLHDQTHSSTVQHGGQLHSLQPSLLAEDEVQQHGPEQDARGGASRPRGIADIIRRFDSGSVWGSPQQGAHVKRPSPGSPKHVQHGAHTKSPSVDSIKHAQQSPRISALIPKGQKEEEHSSGPTESDLPAQDQGDESPVLPVNPDGSFLSEVSSDQPWPKGLLRHASLTKGTVLQPQLTGQGSFALPQLQGQGSSMRGDLWLPQLWLKPAEEMQDSASPRNRMHKAMEAVRAAERAVEAASVFAPTR